MLIDGCSLTVRMSSLIENPDVARLMHDAMLMTKSGAARKLGLIIPSPPLLTLSLVIRVANGGKGSSSGSFKSCWKNVEVMSSIPEVSGPIQLYHCSKFDSLSIG